MFHSPYYNLDNQFLSQGFHKYDYKLKKKRMNKLIRLILFTITSLGHKFKTFAFYSFIAMKCYLHFLIVTKLAVQGAYLSIRV